MALPPPGPRQIGPHRYIGPTEEDLAAYRREREAMARETSPDETAPPPAEAPAGDGGGEPAPAPTAPPPLPPPPSVLAAPGAGGGAFEGSFAQPGMVGTAPFRTPEFFSGRISGPPEIRRLGPGAPIGGMVDLAGNGGGSPFDDEEKRRLLAAIMGGRS